MKGVLEALLANFPALQDFWLQQDHQFIQDHRIHPCKQESQNKINKQKKHWEGSCYLTELLLFSNII